MTLVSKKAIQVHPEQGYFVNFDVDTTYVIPFTIRNATREMCTVRFTPPSNQRIFHINTNPVRLAPGLTHIIEAEFNTHVLQDYQDSFIVFTDKESITVPLIVKCYPDLEFPSTINFGRVERNRQGLSRVLRFTNRGRREVHVRLNSPQILLKENNETSTQMQIQVRPNACIAPPLSSTDVYVELQKLEVGRHIFPIEVIIEEEEKKNNKEKEPRRVSVIVEVADCRGTLLDPRTGLELHALNFKKTYAGTKRTIEVEVYNESDQPVSFAFQAAGEMLGEIIPFNFTPQQGRLSPHQKLIVTAIFTPPIISEGKGWSCRRDKQQARNETYEWLYSLLFVEAEHTHTVRLTGMSTTTVGWLSNPVLDFGQCCMNDYRDLTLMVHNGHEDTPLHFNFPRIAHFVISPSNGKVSPSSACPVRITFRPRRLGNFNERVAVIFNETEQHMLEISGVATSLSPVPKIIGGIDKLPEDFKRPVKTALPIKDSYSPITGPAAHKTKISEVDIGMIPAEGLEPPEPELPTNICKTKLSNGFTMMRGVENFSPVTLDAKTLIRKVFKETPNNAVERRDCRRELQPMELLRVAAPIKVLDYQRVTVGSKSTKTFFLYNGTSAAILAAMPTEEAHLSFTPQSQVIPAGRAAAFDVCFYSSAVQTYQQVVQMTINGRHMLRFTLQADVVPVEVSLSRDDVVLHFGNFGDDPVARAPVILSNHGNSEALYNWVINTGPFTITPINGTIAPMSKVTAQITFSPPQGVLNAETKAELHVKGATSVKILNIKGIISPTFCTWGAGVTTSGNTVVNTSSSGISGGTSLATTNNNEYNLDLQQVPAGMATTVTVSLQNKGRHSAYFSIDSIPEWLNITPASGRVGAGESEDINLVIHHDIPELLQTSILCCVRGMKRPLRLNLTANICISPLSIISPERRNGEILLAFNTVYIGTEKELPLSFRNTGDVAAVVLIDLRHHSEYSLRSLENNNNNNTTLLEWRGHGEQISGIFYVTISPHSEAIVLFVYRPISACNDERFFVTWRHIGTGETNPLPPLAVSGHAVMSKINVKRQVLDFPRTVVGTPAVPMSLTIENTSAEEVKWELLMNQDNNNNNNMNTSNIGSNRSLFHMNPENGILAPYSTQLVHATFVPSVVGQHQERYCVYLDGNQQYPCAEVRVSGFAALPRIVCDRDELIFPAVPLNITVTETMYISNDGFDSIEVFYKSTEPGPLTITFPRGAIARSSTSIPVQVEFCCSKPVSFSSSITFTSDKGEILTIPVIGTAINSFLTNAPYVMHQRSRSHISAISNNNNNNNNNNNTDSADSDNNVKELNEQLIYYDDAPVPLSNTTSISLDKNQQLKPSPFNFIDNIGRTMYSRYCIENLRQWLNYNVFHEPVNDLISVLQSTDGRALLDAVHKLTGKAPRKMSKTSIKDKSISSLEQLISFIKSHGGCLSDVRLPYLMSYEVYCRYQDRCEIESISQSNFNIRAEHAWVTVILQFIRVIYIPKLDLTVVLRNYPAMKTYIPYSTWDSIPFQNALHNSNIFSAEEGILLRWAAHCLNSCINEGILKLPFKNIHRFDDLSDGLAVLACILMFVPSAATRVPLERLVSEPTTQTEMENNITLILGALTYIGIPLRTTPRELLEYNAVDWLLLTATLFTYLPRFIPSTVVSLEGKLLAPMKRSVEVANTSNISRSYTVEMSNSAFRALPQEISVDPSAVLLLEVEVTLRFNRRLEGKCVLVDTSAGLLMEERTPIVFRLIAIPNDEPLRIINIQTPLYTVLNHEIQVESPFAQNCVATLRLAQEYHNDAEYIEGDFGKSIQSAFYTSAGVVPFRSGESTKVALQFSPCARGKYEARITFHDEQQGEFSCVIIGTCTPPKPTDKVTVRAEVGEECQHTLLVKLSNTPFERMLRSLEDHRRQPALRTTKANLLPDLTGVPYSIIFVNDSNIGPNPFFKGPENITFTAGESMVPLIFSFLPKYVGEYSGFIILASKYDVRSIHVIGKCVPAGEKSILRFACPARQTITQGVPVVNNSKESWLITATIEGVSFSGPRELRVLRGKNRDYPLRYNPAWVSSDKGMLTLFNNETGERRIYSLIGEAEEPLSEETLIIECKARERRTVVLTVPDINGTDTVYQIETDLPFARGESSLLVRRSATGAYSLILQPMMGGNYAGTVICRASNGRYCWYALTVIVSPPEKEGIVEIKTDARTPVTADISIQNPTNKSVVFTVRRFGVGLFGENSILVEAEAPAVYSLLFVPSHIGNFDGRIAFCSDEVGEFWYELKIIVEAAVPEEITFESEIGTSDLAQVRIPNNTSIEKSIYVSNSNPRNFSTAPSLLTIPPYSELTVDILYTPTTVNKTQESLLKLYNPDLGEWSYICRGIGLPPAESAPIECICEVGGKVTVSLKIKNPFETSITLEVNLKCGNEGYYTLTGFHNQQQQQQSIGPGAETSIPLTYTPKSVGNHEATVIVRPISTNNSSSKEIQDITWKFPLKGLAEWRCRDAPLRFRCVARRQLEEIIKLEAPGLTEEEKKKSSVLLELDPHQQYLNAVKSSFQCKVINTDITSNELSVNIRFAPLRSFMATADLIIRSEKGAAWRYSIILDAVRAEIDDTLTIKASLRSVSAITFDMYNVFPHNSPFNAYFTPDSSRDLSVANNRGVLKPFIVGQKNAGTSTPIQVQFAPSARVPQVEGTLIVDTDDMQWSFKVIGKLESKSTL